MAEKHIPHINQDLDFKLLLHVLSKNMIWIVFLFVLGLISAFLLIRYTKPVYRAKSVIQLTSNENEQKNILDEKLNPYTSKNLAKEIELLRSPVFLQRVLNKIPVDISYFIRGAILNYESYKSTPFFVEYETIEPAIYGKKMDLQILDQGAYSLMMEGEGQQEAKHTFGEWVSVGGTKFRVILKPDQPLELSVKYYFTFNNPKYLVDELVNSLSVQILSEPAKTIEISYSGYNASKVTDIVNGVAKEFEYFNLEKKQESASRVLDYIDQTLGIVSGNLNDNEKELNRYAPGEIKDPFLLQMEQSRSYDRIITFEEEEVKMGNDTVVLEKLKKQPIDGRNDLANAYALVAGTGLQSSVGASLDRFSQLYNNYDDLSYSAPEGSPTLDKIKFQIEQEKKAYAAMLLSLENVLEEKLSGLRLSRAKINVASGNGIDTSNLNASMVKRIKEVNEKFFNQLIEKKAEYAIAKEGFTPEYQILEFATVPEKPIAPDKQVIIITAVGAWLLLSLLLVGIRYLLNDEILLIRDISKFTDAPILGMIHKYKEDIPVSQLVVDRKPKGLIAEAFRTARTNLQFIYNEPGPKVISLTSTISGEGKTFVSINLAGILAFSGNRVIVIDCDMRKPKIHVGFETDNDLGMSTILIGKNTIDECIRHSQMENLDFITAGPIPPNPAELLLTSKMDQTISELKGKYDFVVIDNPPSGLVSDAVVNLQRADYPIYVFRSDYSRKFFINNLIRLKEENKISNISCILNSVDLQKNRSYGYGYGYGSYNYGYGYGYGFGYYEEDTTTKSGRTGSRIYNLVRGKKQDNV